ncbi:MAG TPA: DUF4832 domain-containing protein [Ktedonosporobacter sp.]|nr:DUF4832 domain-containing protein [Ktedonosporobacter sp.]
MQRKIVFTRTQLLASGLIVLSLILGGFGAFYAYQLLKPPSGKTAELPTISGNVTLSSKIIPLSDPEIGNPQRGPQYAGSEAPPQGWPLTDRYDRFCWSHLETAEGQYDFSRIDDGIAKAKAAGYTFGWRIMPVNTGGSGESCLPQYLKDALPGSFTVNTNSEKVFIPDYNDPKYLERVQALVTALGQRYDSNPNVGMLDMSFYGCWGEWNESCTTNGEGPGKGIMSAENRQKLIDLQFQAFPHKRFLMLTEHQDSLDYALNYQRPLRTGVRIDCLGEPGADGLGGARKTLDNDATAHNQWKIAPLYFEYCKGPDFSKALQDIKQYHASIIGDGLGNIQDFSSYSSSDQDLMTQNYKASGYRFELNGISLPKTLTPGSDFTVYSKWTNENTAPAYQPWNVMMQLRGSNNAVVWQGKSQLDLQQPFSDDSPGGDSTVATDKFTLPGNLAHGNYQVCVQITDPGQVYAPLALANVGRADDGSYCAGSVSI